MRTTVFLFGIFALSLVSAPAQQTVILSPQHLTGWTLVGTNADELSSGPAVALPAGAQAFRSFGPNDLSLTVTTQPVFGSGPADWPVIELGTSALVLSRSGDAGKLVLVSGNDSPVELPFVLGLDAAGRSAAPLTIGFSRTGAVIKVEVSGQSFEHTVGSEAEAPRDVVVSAGAGHPFEFAQLKVTFGSTDPGAPGGTAGSGATVAAAGNSSSGDSSTPPRRETRIVSLIDPTGALVMRVEEVPAPTPPGTVVLQVLTPPAVRHGRAEQVRAALSQSNQP